MPDPIYANVTTPEPIVVEASAGIPVSQKARENGVATLDGDGLVPEAQVPTRLTEANLGITIGSVVAEALDGFEGGGGVDIADVGYDIVIVAGQSNASGSGTPNFTAAFDSPNDRVFQYATNGTYQGEVIQAIDPLEFPAADISGGVGPAVQFGKEWTKRTPTNRQVLIVPVAVGGTALVSGPWAVGGTHYNNALSFANAAVSAAGPNSRVVAFLWLQGEDDAVSGRTQSAYAVAQDAMIAGFRAGITGASDAPFVIGSMVPEWIAAPNGTSAQINAAHADTPNRVANSLYVVGPTGYTQDTGGIHYTAAGARLLGKLMCEALFTEPTAPGQVTGLDATPGDGEVDLVWSPVLSATDYVIEYKLSASGSWLTFADGVSALSVATVTGLTNDSAYDFRVTASNIIGAGPVSAVVSETPTGTPDVPLPDPSYLVDARTLGLSDGAAVTTWSDTSSNANHVNVTQSDSAKRPTYRVAGANGHPSVQFDGNDSLEAGSFPVWFDNDTGEFTAVGVFSTTNFAAQRAVFALRDGSGGLFHLSVGTDGKASTNVLNGTPIGSTAVSASIAGEVTLAIIVRSSAGVRIWVNGIGGSTESSAASTSDGVFPLSLGHISGDVWPFLGHISYAAIYPAALTTEERQTVENNLMTAFDITP